MQTLLQMRCCRTSKLYHIQLHSLAFSTLTFTHGIVRLSEYILNRYLLTERYKKIAFLSHPWQFIYLSILTKA